MHPYVRARASTNPTRAVAVPFSVSYREEAINGLQGPAPSNLQNPAEVEKTIFEKSKSSVRNLASLGDKFLFLYAIPRARDGA